MIIVYESKPNSRWTSKDTVAMIYFEWSLGLSPEGFDSCPYWRSKMEVATQEIQRLINPQWIHHQKRGKKSVWGPFNWVNTKKRMATFLTEKPKAKTTGNQPTLFHLLGLRFFVCWDFPKPERPLRGPEHGPYQQDVLLVYLGVKFQLWLAYTHSSRSYIPTYGA